MDIDDHGHVQQIFTTNCESPILAFTLRIMYLGLSVYIFKQIFFPSDFLWDLSKCLWSKNTKSNIRVIKDCSSHSILIRMHFHVFKHLLWRGQWYLPRKKKTFFSSMFSKTKTRCVIMRLWKIKIMVEQILSFFLYFFLVVFDLNVKS